MFKVKNMTLKYGSKIVIKNMTFNVAENDWYMMLGPNGAGKSTVVKAISGEIDYAGSIQYKGQNIKSFSPKHKARHIGILTQHHHPAYPFTVEEVVELGRYAHQKGVFNDTTQQDEEMIEKALAITGLESFRNKSILSLSGGELQRAFLAQVLAQDPNVLILDEPANHLDLAYQEQIFNTIQEWLKEKDRCVISIVHDLSVAKYYGNRGILLTDSGVISEGLIGEVLNQEYLIQAYKVDVQSLMHKRYAVWA